ncbi:MAG: class I SAM-dependent methyltransferase [Candidatus Parcubacteria bacterium]|nr:class I SAM-dependent methyltransferase [Candidatus Parcubacteria bacterium]
MKKLCNLSGISFECELPDENWIFNLRHGSRTPVDFRQDILVEVYGDLIDRTEKVLEIGCGCGRNAQFFLNETDHIKYYGFDSSELSLKCFKKNSFWDFTNKKDRFYVSNNIDEIIFGQKYDLIFSTYVLQHIGFSTDLSVWDAFYITKELWNNLNIGGYFMIYELCQGQNCWDPIRWKREIFEELYKEKARVVCHKDTNLKGCEDSPHSLIVVEKLSE